MPALARVATRLLSQVASSSACERNWSNYDFIHSRWRNKLDPAHANKLVYAYSNLRVLQNMEGGRVAGKPVSLLDPQDRVQGAASPDVSVATAEADSTSQANSSDHASGSDSEKCSS